MIGMGHRLFLATALAAGMAIPAAAQGPYDVKTMNFDLWCQTEANLPPDRCDKRLPADNAQFEAYRAKIEKYEVPYLQQKENSAQLNRTILHNDPVDNPISKDPSAQQQKPNEPAEKPSPE